MPNKHSLSAIINLSWFVVAVFSNNFLIGKSMSIIKLTPQFITLERFSPRHPETA